MKNIVDSSAWLEYFVDSKNAENFSKTIEDLDNLIVSSINIYEIYKKLLIEIDENTALQAIGIMQQGHVIPVDELISINAAKLSVEYKLPLADSIILATAKSQNAVLWTQDIDFKGLQGVKYFKKKK
ncbi:MAG: type II toxin-antitoxin system VapC family toxin [Ignavibacteriae bacterium]|nr:MAG: type II toxin-antitoxin system VapC family toxin [Ignavibacteriota bacterium]